MGKDKYYEERQIGLKTYYRIHPAFNWRELSNEELTKKINKLQAKLKWCEGKPVSNEPQAATCNIPRVNDTVCKCTDEPPVYRTKDGKEVCSVCGLPLQTYC